MCKLVGLRLWQWVLMLCRCCHWTGDPWRGSVWEEAIINCPRHIQMLAMSATVKNPDDLGGWITQVSKRPGVLGVCLHSYWPMRSDGMSAISAHVLGLVCVNVRRWCLLPVLIKRCYAQYLSMHHPTPPAGAGLMGRFDHCIRKLCLHPTHRSMASA